MIGHLGLPGKVHRQIVQLAKAHIDHGHNQGLIGAKFGPIQGRNILGMEGGNGPGRGMAQKSEERIILGGRRDLEEVATGTIGTSRGERNQR